jgi:flagellar L-ring protein precursor FlgH
MKKLNLLAPAVFLLTLSPGLEGKSKAKPKPKPDEISAVDQYVTEAMARVEPSGQAAGSPGSLWSTSALLSDLARDLRASRVDDLVTIQVTEKADASSTGDTKTSRQSAAKSNIASLLGPKAAKGALANLANLSGSTSLQGQGATTRQTALTTTLSARVTRVLPNGFMVVEGHKDTMINSERQIVSVRGVVRPADLGPGNAISSDRLAQLELRINGKGVVGDAIRRPNFIYRILLGILPF